MMKIRYMRMVLVFIICLFLTDQNAYCMNYDGVKLPIFEKAVDISSHHDEKQKAKSITFKAINEIDCKGAISFYDSALRRLDFIPFSDDGLGEGEWKDEQNINTLFNKDRLPLKFIKSWVDGNRNIRVFLTVNAFKDRAATVQCTVECAVFKFYSLENANTFFESITNDEKNHIFSLISQYTNKDGTVNLAKALDDNPHDELLLRFSKINTN